MRPFTFVGVVHAPPLPAGPRPSSGFATARERVLDDADALAIGGAHAVILENFGDAPFSSGPVEPHVVAFFAHLAALVRGRHPHLSVGINLLRNDARAALGVAAAVEAAFIRVNVLTGAMVTDQGVIEGDAHRLLRYRRELDADVQIVADLLVKHAAPLAPLSLASAAADTWQRGGADVLVITGRSTGHPADPADAEEVRRAVPQAPLWVGSGVTESTAGEWRARVDGAIIGTALHRDGDVQAPLDVDRVRRMADALGVEP